MIVMVDEHSDGQEVCGVEACANPVYIKKRRLCKAHYQRWYKTGSPLPRPRVITLRCDAVKCCRREVNAPLVICEWHHAQSLAAGPATYEGAHKLVKKERGKAHEHSCAECDSQAAHWAYNHNDPDERVSANGPWSRNPSYYDPMCRSCHAKRDRLVSYRFVIRTIKRLRLDELEEAILLESLANPIEGQ